MLRKRAETMLLGTGERSVASGIAAVASEGTYGLVIAVRGAASKLWDDRQDEIKAACAPQLIDDIDVTAYLIADALGRPLMHADDTNAVGKRIATTAKRVRKAGRDAEVYKGLNLPDRTVGRVCAEREPPSLRQLADEASMAASSRALAVSKVAWRR